MIINQQIFVGYVLLLTSSFLLIDATEKRYTQTDLSPVILVPGLGGNKIYAKLDKPNRPHLLCSKKSDYFDLWLDALQMVPFRIDCWVDNIKQKYDAVLRTTENMPGVETKLPTFGDTNGIETIDSSMGSSFHSFSDYFKFIADALVERGYVRGVSLFGAAYDFRKGPNENQKWFSDLKTLTETAYKTNNEIGVTFIVHSLGGKMILHFLQQMSQTWKDQYVKKVISLNSVWGGSINSLLAIISGYNFDQELIMHDQMKEVQRTFPSVVWLLPSSKFWKSNDELVTINGISYSVKNLDQLFRDINVSNVVEMRKDLDTFQNFTAPGVELHCLFGSKLDTPKRLKYVPTSSQPDIEMEDGDGTVSTHSLQGFNYWKMSPEQGDHAIFHKELTGIEHYAILKDFETINYILENLIGFADYPRVHEYALNKYSEKVMPIRLF